jgi:SAM-dependent methyltransferase
LQDFRVYRAARFAWHFCRDPIFRRDHLLLWQRPERLYQHRSITAPDRYPAIFEFLQQQLAGIPQPRLLSFGCSTGEEVFSLRRYFPSAQIKGVDINPGNIAICRARLAREPAAGALEFAVADSTANEPHETYHAVLCMAVFVRWQLKADREVTTSEPHLRFADFERAAAELAACVAPGGFLIVRHAMFRFEDTVASRSFECVLSLPTPNEFFPRFGPDNRRLPEIDREAVVFRKRPTPTR